MQVLFVDLQTSLVAQSKTTPPQTIGTATGVLAKVAQILKLPTLFSVVLEGENPPKLIAPLLPYSNPANTFLRNPAGALMDPATVQAVARSGRRTLVIAGYVAEVAILHAALDAIAAGYTVYYVVDCIGSPSPRTESAAFRELELAGAVPTSVLSLTTRLAPDFSQPPGSETFAALSPILKQ
ncbi:isochorismatase family protein [Sphingomonas montana]|uniref:isochorismatase family protein n=1 Tax=Sphingomonas montana TaxID=1843236 RepID=UPI00096EC2F3|nr:isochorismatase family protein [Sphingomonas montana]